eukprot:58490-Rhodomonas_salina.1
MSAARWISLLELADFGVQIKLISRFAFDPGAGFAGEPPQRSLWPPPPGAPVYESVMVLFLEACFDAVYGSTAMLFMDACAAVWGQCRLLWAHGGP